MVRTSEVVAILKSPFMYVAMPLRSTDISTIVAILLGTKIMP